MLVEWPRGFAFMSRSLISNSSCFDPRLLSSFLGGLYRPGRRAQKEVGDFRDLPSMDIFFGVLLQADYDAFGGGA